MLNMIRKHHNMAKRVTNKNLRESSKNWIKRQINDPYVALAKKEGYRSRAAYKIIGIQEKFEIFKTDSIILDLGAAPGGWSQVAAKLCKSVIAVDILPIDPIPNVNIVQGNFFEEVTLMKIGDLLKDMKIDVILSDMAPNSCGIGQVDHLRIMGLAEAVSDFGERYLKTGGSSVMKIFQGGAENCLLNRLKRNFRLVRHFKPAASRSRSSEMYVVATGFLG
jgi:23S rRNA (uridine2552-2'-O)-methyltransferase